MVDHDVDISVDVDTGPVDSVFAASSAVDCASGVAVSSEVSASDVFVVSVAFSVTISAASASADPLDLSAVVEASTAAADLVDDDEVAGLLQWCFW